MEFSVSVLAVSFEIVRQTINELSGCMMTHVAVEAVSSSELILTW